MFSDPTALKVGFIIIIFFLEKYNFRGGYKDQQLFLCMQRFLYGFSQIVTKSRSVKSMQQERYVDFFLSFMFVKVLLDLLRRWNFTSLEYIDFCISSVTWTGWSDSTWWRWHGGGVVVAEPRRASTERLCLSCRTDLSCDRAVWISRACVN